MEPTELDRDIAGLAALEEPVRRSLYHYVVDQQRDVSRDEAAGAAGLSRTMAGFHLDRLVEDGLLDASFRRLSGRSGPGAGRPAKLYRRSGRQFAVSLPPRSYELAARILAETVDAAGAGAARPALKKTAQMIGLRIGADARAGAGPRPGRKRLLAGTHTVLAANGYEPVQTTAEIRLRNCPFHALVDEHRELVCGMNLALIEGVVEGLNLPGACPVLDPRPDMCCVSVRLDRKIKV